MKKKVILIRSRAFDPAIFKLANTLYNNGLEVQILTWDRGNDFKDDYPYKVHKFGLKAPYDRWYALFYWPFWWIYEFYILLKDDSPIIHATDFDTIIPAVLAKIFKKKLLYYTLYDFYADNSPPFIPQVFKRFLASLEKYFIGFTDYLFLVDQSRINQVKGCKIKNLEFIYNSPPDTYRKMDSQKDEKIIFYAGLLDRSRGLEYVLDVLNDIKDIKLIIAGYGPCKTLIEELSKDNQNINYVGYLNYDEVINNSLKADVLFAFYDPEISNNIYASPNKLFEAMMCKKPIIMNWEINSSKIVDEENCGILVPYGNKENLKKAINELLEDSKLREELGANGRNAYDTKYSWKIMEERLLKAYNYFS